MVAVRVSPDIQHAIVGAPLYFQSHAAPTSPRELLSHRCINFRHRGESVYKWELDKQFSRHGHDPCYASSMTYGRTYWEQLWSKTLREHPGKVAQRSPNAHLIAVVASLRPGRSLDAGCGHGAKTLWREPAGAAVVDHSQPRLTYGFRVRIEA